MGSCNTRSGTDSFSYAESFYPAENMVQNRFDFDGYTDYWHTTSQVWTRYGNLFKTTSSSPEPAIIRSKFDIAEDLGMRGLFLQEGFVNELINAPFIILEEPQLNTIEDSLAHGNVLVITDAGSEVNRALEKKYPHDNRLQRFINERTSYNERVEAIVLTNGNRKLFVVTSTVAVQRNQLKELLLNTLKVLKDFDLHRGWFGVQTLLNSVTCTPGHPLEVIGKGMNEGNSWFVFSGYMDFLSKQELQHWMEKAKLPVITDVGFATGHYPNIFGCNDYDGLQVQSLFTYESWARYARSKNGYAFRQVYDVKADASGIAYDGYIAKEGNKEQIDGDSFPFVSETGNLESGAVPSMVLFTKKDELFTRQKLWESILDRRGVAILEKGKMMGPALYRKALGLLLLDRVFLEEYFGDRINIEAGTEGYQLQVTIKNTYAHEVSGNMVIAVPPELRLLSDSVTTVNIPPGAAKTLTFALAPGADAMNRATPIAVHYRWGSKEKTVLAMLDMPPAISVHQLLYGHTPVVKYPVTIHNFTSDTSFPVEIEVMDNNKTATPVFKTSRVSSTATGAFAEMLFDLQLLPGHYFVKVKALGVECISQLGVGSQSGVASVKEVDFNNDGINEYVMENDSVKATLLTTGARIIEYIVKPKNENVLFKLWPDKPVDDRRPFRKREFYPYGGFEDFLGQPSIETNEDYTAEVIRSDGDYVQVKMTADYYGNKLEKIFTLYGNSPLLEVRFALTFRNPELNMLGPQPILSIGKTHGPEDQYIFPEPGGLSRYSMDPDKYYGRIFFLKEGWNAGYDTKEHISFIGAFPVEQPLFLHMWMNHPSNPGSMYFYTELQPWTRIFQKTVTYFSYYLWAASAPWEQGVQSLRERNLVTVRR
jgi:hypothetical protein